MPPLTPDEQEELDLLKRLEADAALGDSISTTPPDTTRPPTDAGTDMGALGSLVRSPSELLDTPLGPLGSFARDLPPPLNVGSMTPRDVGTAISNVPSDALRVGQDLASLAVSPDEETGEYGLSTAGLEGLSQGIASALVGAPQVVNSDVLPFLFPAMGRLESEEEESNEAKVARAMAKEATALLRDPKGRIINSPVQAAMDIAAIAVPGGITQALASRSGKVGAIASMATNISRKVHPVNIAINIVKGPGKKVARALGRTKNIQNRIAEATNVGEMSTRLAGEAGRQGNVNFIKALLDPETATEGVAKKAVRAVEQLDDLRGLGWDEMSKKLRLDPNNPIDINAVEARIFRFLEDDYGIKVKNVGLDPDNPGAGRIVLETTQGNPIGDKAKLNKLKEALESFAEWETPGIDEGHAAQRRVGSYIRRGDRQGEFATVNGIHERIMNEIREEMSEKVPGYRARADLYHDMSEQLAELRDLLKIKDAKITEAMLTKFGTLLNDRLSSNLGLRRRAVQQMGELLGGGENLMQELAGAKFGRETIQGIAKARGSSGGLGAAAGGTLGATVGQGMGLGIQGTGALTSAGVLVGGGLHRLLSRSTIGNPRLMGRFLYSAGADPKFAKEVQMFYTRLKSEAKKVGLKDDIAAGAALEGLNRRTRDRLEMEYGEESLEFIGL